MFNILSVAGCSSISKVGKFAAYKKLFRVRRTKTA